jgi:formylglycine-generating enzyme required for sulfatase activity
MVRIPAGWFSMGSDRGREDERPVHRVWVDGFLMDRFEVTQAQLRRYLPAVRSRFKGDELPAEQLNWDDAAEYCNKRSEAEGLTPCYRRDAQGNWHCDFAADGYRLPTEAEWEYACRAGSGGAYFFGDEAARLGRYAWYVDNAGGKTHPVGRKRPNRWGLHDILGNVAEWCHDAYDPGAYPQGERRNPRGPVERGEDCALRGGSFKSKAQRLRSAARRGELGYKDNCENREHLGFRCVRRAPAARPQTDAAAPG